MTERQKAILVLGMNTLAFFTCFACWMMYGVLIAFLVDNGVYQWDKGQMGLLIGTPVLTGSLLRLPLGILTDRYGGKPVFTLLMLASAGAMYSVAHADSYIGFLLAGLGFGLAGASFAVGVAYTSVWFPKEQQGTALGIFGAGNTGAALTSIFAPMLLLHLTDSLENLDGWRTLPKLYALLLVAMSALFFLCTFPKKADQGQSITIKQRLEPLKNMRVWRFGLYYFLVFGGFVALSQWLISYYTNVYVMPLATAGLMTSMFILPAGIIRGIGGILSDKFGASAIMYMVLSCCLLCSLMLSIPRFDFVTPGQGVIATNKGKVTFVSEERVMVDDKSYPIKPQSVEMFKWDEEKELLIFPKTLSWQKPIVKAGDSVHKGQLLASGITFIRFQANVWIISALIFILGAAMGIGGAAVFKYIPQYFPNNVGVVGGIVGVLGGLGGFAQPILFGYLLGLTGIWTTCWIFLTLLSLGCLIWLKVTINRMMRQQVPQLMSQIE